MSPSAFPSKRGPPEGFYPHENHRKLERYDKRGEVGKKAGDQKHPSQKFRDENYCGPEASRPEAKRCKPIGKRGKPRAGFLLAMRHEKPTYHNPHDKRGPCRTEVQKKL